MELDKLSVGGNPARYKLPSPKTEGAYDFSFSGLKTAVINLVHNAEQKGEVIERVDMVACFCATVSDILWGRLERAARDKGFTTIALAGGVSANSWLRVKAQERCDALGGQLYMPQLPLCGDNAAMIGSQGYYEYLAGSRAGMELNGKPYMEIDKAF